MRKKLMVTLVSIVCLLGISIVGNTVYENGKNEETLTSNTKKQIENNEENKTSDETEQFSVSENVSAIENKTELFSYPIEYELDEKVKQNAVSLYASSDNVFKMEDGDVTSYSDDEDSDKATYWLDIEKDSLSYYQDDVEGMEKVNKEDMEKVAYQKLEECGITKEYDIRYKNTVSHTMNHTDLVQYEMYIDNIPVSNGMHGYQGQDIDAIGVGFSVEFTNNVWTYMSVNKCFSIKTEKKKKVKSVVDATYDGILKYVESYQSQFEDEKEYLASEIVQARWVYMPELTEKGNWVLMPEIEITCQTKSIAKTSGSVTPESQEVFYLDVTTGQFYVGVAESM